jgi:hypothetical protein
MRWLCVVVAACPGVARGDEASLEPRAGVVLLHNGELIAGKIIPAGDRYDVHLETGEIHLRRSEVAMVCRDADECYRHKRSGIEVGRVQDHLELAEWCLRHRLLAAAEIELKAARAADAAHPRIKLLEARLALSREPAPQEPAKAIAKTAHETPAAADMTLPAGAMEGFANTIQPILLNYCAKGGCHAGHRGAPMQLERLHPRQAGRLATQRNVQKVLLLVDRQQPMASRLLVAPIRPHGSAKGPVFTSRQQSQYRQLTEWVQLVAGVSKAQQPLPLEDRTAPLLQNVPGADGRTAEAPSAAGAGSRPPEMLPAGLVEAGESSRIPASSADQAFTREELQARGLLQQALCDQVPGRPAAPAAFVPKDPFDPEIFNRRFFGPAGESASTGPANPPTGAASASPPTPDPRRDAPATGGK